MKLTIFLARVVCAAIWLAVLFHGLKIYRVAHDALTAWFMWSGWSEYDARYDSAPLALLVASGVALFSVYALWCSIFAGRLALQGTEHDQ